jgi:hypothetical protein
MATTDGRGEVTLAQLSPTATSREHVTVLLTSDFRVSFSLVMNGPKVAASCWPRALL